MSFSRILILAVLSFSAVAAPALADCASPAGIPGETVFNADHGVLQYCDGAAWVAFGKSGESPINAVRFSPASSLTSMGLIGATDGSSYTLSFWFRVAPQSPDAETQIIWETTSGRIQAGLSSLSTNNNLYSLWVHGKSASDVELAVKQTTEIIAENVWYHVLFSANTGSGSAHLYVNDAVPSFFQDSVTTGMMDLAASFYTVGYLWSGDIADFWFQPNLYLDLTNSANRRKFISANEKAVYLGPDGSLPAGQSPLVFLSGGSAIWHTNKGSGGGFAKTGTIVDAPNDPPVELACINPAGVTGEMFFNAAHRFLQWCDGYQWRQAGPEDPPGPMSGCADPIGIAGEVVFNAAYSVLQYCDGDAWRAIGE